MRGTCGSPSELAKVQALTALLADEADTTAMLAFVGGSGPMGNRALTGAFRALVHFLLTIWTDHPDPLCAGRTVPGLSW